MRYTSGNQLAVDVSANLLMKGEATAASLSALWTETHQHDLYEIETVSHMSPKNCLTEESEHGKILLWDIDYLCQWNLPHLQKPGFGVNNY